MFGLLLTVCVSAPAALHAQPIEGITAEGFYRLESPADLALIQLTIIGRSESPVGAERVLQSHAAQAVSVLREHGLIDGSLRETDRAILPDPAGSGWRATRDLQASLRRTTSPDTAANAGTNAGADARTDAPADALAKALQQLHSLAFLTIERVAPASSQLDSAQSTAIERATAEARRKAEVAARELGFALGPVREVRVNDTAAPAGSEASPTALVSVEAKVVARFALVPATTQTEVLAIAAAKENKRPAEPLAASALTIEIVAAIYDSTGRGRFTTAAGTVWREVVPVPAQQRLKSGRTYRGTISPGIFGGYRMELAGIPRILKVEPVADQRP